MREVPQGLRTWFVIHFWDDILTAIPLFIAPEALLGFLGWPNVDPFTTRLVAAALFGIGIESWLGRNARAESFQTMLNLKIIWSFAASVGLLWGIIEAGDAAPLLAWGILAIFLPFHIVWVYWRWRINDL